MAHQKYRHLSLPASAFFFVALTASLMLANIARREENMLPSELLRLHRDEILEIMKQYPRLSNIRVVGSVARGEDTEESDIDFLVDPAPDAGLFDLGGLHEDLEELLGIPVDVISSRSRMREYMKMTLERDAANCPSPLRLNLS